MIPRKHKVRKQIISFALCLSMMFSGVPSTVHAASGGETAYHAEHEAENLKKAVMTTLNNESQTRETGTKVSDLSSLKNALAEAVSGDTITLTADVTAGAGELLVIPEGVTLSSASGVTLTNQGTIIFPSTDSYAVNQYAGTGTVMIGTEEISDPGIIFEGKLYYDGGDLTNTGVELYKAKGNTYYTAGEGYAVYKKYSGDEPYGLTLVNATIGGTVRTGSYIYFTGVNSITSEGGDMELMEEPDIRISAE